MSHQTNPNPEIVGGRNRKGRKIRLEAITTDVTKTYERRRRGFVDRVSHRSTDPVRYDQEDEWNEFLEKTDTSKAWYCIQESRVRDGIQ